MKATGLGWASLLILSGAQASDSVLIQGSASGQRAFDTPYALSVIDADTLAVGGLRVNLSETLARVPGLHVNDRQNLAQDQQLSVRGWGARASFGVRGVRLLTDGIPASMPDGQGQVAHFDLASATRIEVLRGPFSALHGASSGGVIALVTRAPQTDAVEAGFDVVSNGQRQWRAALDRVGDAGTSLRAQVGRLTQDGTRAHSAGERDLATLRGGWRGARDELTVHVNALRLQAQDPLGLTRAQWQANPGQTTAEALLFDTRKRVEQMQAGGRWQRQTSGGGAWVGASVSAYAGQRAVIQWLAVPVAAQTNPRHAGGVIDFDRNYAGVDARTQWRGERWRVTAGLAAEGQTEHRLGAENFIGAQLGVTGRVRRDERNRASTTDAYAQAEIDVASNWVLSLGARAGRVDLRSLDAFLANGDDSGQRSHGFVNPVAALQWRVSPSWHVHASWGRGFEAPTLGELAYRADATPGFNTALRAQTSRQWELGSKWRSAQLEAELALFQADTDAEIAVRSNQGGRATFHNVGATRRQGVEASARWQPAPHHLIGLSLATLDARHRSGFLACAAGVCTTPTVAVPAGQRMAGTPAQQVFAEWRWPLGSQVHGSLEWRARSRVSVNDVGSDAAPGFAVVALRLARHWELDAGRLTLHARIDNLGDRVHVGSVIVNEGNSRFFEPGPRRSLLLGAQWRQRW